MRRTQFDKQSTGRRNLSCAPSLGIPGSGVKDATSYANRIVSWAASQEHNYLQRSVSADNVVIRSRGYKPSDRHDPVKRNFLEHLTSKILHFDMESGQSTPINLKKLLTPASDSQELLHAKNKKMYASSYFYAPTHPTVEDQVELARRISLSLSDVKNMKSKGQSMYVNRKKRSVKWIHDGNGADGEDEPPSPVHKDKIPLKCMMNPNGKVLDIHGIQALGEEVNIEPMPSHPEKLFDIVRDLNNQRGRGAEIFAKRRKRSEKWVVDKDQPQTPNTPATPKTPIYSGKMEMNENVEYPNLQSFLPYTPTTTAENKPFYNPFTVDLSLDSTNPPTTGRKDSRCGTSECRHSKEVKKIYLREVAVGTDADFPRDAPEKSRRGHYDDERRGGNGYSNGVHQSNHQRPGRRYNNGNNNYNYNHNDSPAAAKQRGHCGATNRDGRNACNAASRETNARNSAACRDVARNAARNVSKETRHANGVASIYGSGKDPRNGRSKQLRSANERAENVGNNNNVGNHVGKGRKANDSSRRDFETRSESEESEYTPVPVKQLIQEFEKTCRPVMQYKQISPRVIPIVQQCPIGNDITRFFDTRRSTKYDGVEEEMMEEDEEEDEEEEDYVGHQQDMYEQPRGLQPRQTNGYVSTDDTECTSDTSESEPGIFHTLMPIGRANVVATTNGDRDYRMIPIERYDDRRVSITSQELEAYYDRNGDVKFVNSETDVPLQAKSLMLSMVASQDKILETIKNLRNTPVLDNLLSVASPECKLDPASADVGNKLAEINNTYGGPKISSFNNLKNYNTAPRGWDQSLTYYRPITFQKPQDTIVYSDF